MSKEIDITPGTEPTVLETPIEVVETVVETPVEPEEKRFEFQPIDDQGRPVGGKQVIKYRTAEELGEKMAEQNKLLILKLRSETRKNRLGIQDNETFGDDAPRFATPVSFEPKELTPDQKASLAISIGVSPEDFDNVTDELFEAKIGVKPSDLRKTLQEIQQERIAGQALAEAEAFKKSNPEFIMCPENSEAITNWLARYNLAPVRANFQRAYDTLRAAGVLIENISSASEPVVEPLPVVIEPAATVLDPPAPLEEIPVVVNEPEPLVTPVSRVPVSLNRNNTEESGGPVPPSGSDIVYEVMQGGQKRRFVGLAAIEAMPADEYRRRTISDPTFAKKEAALEKEREARLKARR